MFCSRENRVLYDLDKLQPLEKLGWDYVHDIQNEMSSWKEVVSKILEDQALEDLLGVSTHPLSNLYISGISCHDLFSL